MGKSQTLRSLIDKSFVEGYDAFVDVANRDAQMAAAASLPGPAQAAMRMNHLLTVAMMEGVNDAEAKHDVEVVEAVQLLWRNVGVVLAMMNCQGFTRMNGPVRREMLATLTRGYDETAHAITLQQKAEAQGGAA